MLLRQSLAPLVDLVYPPRCPLCGTGIGQQNGLCPECWAGLSIPGEPACKQCQRPLDNIEATANIICALCMAEPPPYDRLIAATYYTDAARRLVLAYKHGRKIALAPMMARLIASRMPQLDEDWLTVPVPLHRFRLWYRGFNQSALIASYLAREKGLTLVVDALLRPRRTPSLGGLGREARARVLTGAIAVNRRYAAKLVGAKIVLVDDVHTSGATTSACIAALRAAGVSEVIIACFARVEDGRTRPIRAYQRKTPGENPGR